jgi:hypothetical protein
MPLPRVNSIVKAVDISVIDVAVFDIKENDRFIYLGTIAQDPTRCIVEGVYCGKRLVHLHPEDFVEVDPDEI